MNSSPEAAQIDVTSTASGHGSHDACGHTGCSRNGFFSRLSRARRGLLRCSLAALLLATSGMGCGLWPDQADEPVATPKLPPKPENIDAVLDLNNRQFPLLTWSSYVVTRDYVNRDRLDPTEQLWTALTELGRHRPAFFATANADNQLSFTVTVGSATKQFQVDKLDDLMATSDLLSEVLVFTRETLNLEGTPLRELEYHAINGLLAPLDPHTILLDPKEHNDLGVRTRGQFGGIGAEIRVDQRRILIVRVMPGSPAEKAGVKDGDLLLEIADQSTVSMSSLEAQELLRGPVDTEVVVKIRRGDKVLTTTITRAIIRVDSVNFERLTDDIGYVQITTFQSNTGEKVKDALQAMSAERAGGEPTKGGPLKGLVIDLRGNSGGLLTQAIEVLDLLVERGELVIVRSAIGRESQSAKEELALPKAASVVVLIDEDSASASEIVSGAVSALERGVVVGRSSFGKGSVQLLMPKTMYEEEQALKLTIAEYQVAGDKSIQTLGVQPNLTLLPVQLSNLKGIASFYDLERFERRRERSQVAHLPSAKHERDYSLDIPDNTLVRYFIDPKATIEPGQQRGRMEDPEIRLAHAVAKRLTGIGEHKARLDVVGKVQQELAAAEDQRIRAGLADSGIDWSGEPLAHENPTLALRAELVGKQPFAAGEPFVLRVSVKNTGDQPAHRVHLITDCLQDELDGIELLLGTIAPGQQLTQDLRLQVMGWHPDFTDTLRLDVHGGEPDAKPDASTTVRFDIHGAERPQLAFDYWLVDDPTLVDISPKRPPTKPVPGEPEFAVEGNGDGVMQPGERVLLALRVKNIGEGKAEDIRVLLRNRSGAQALLEEGFLELGKLAPGRETFGAFGITVNPKASPKSPVELDLTVIDFKVREQVSHRDELRLFPGRPAFLASTANVRVKGNEPVRLYNGAHGKSQQIATIAPETVVEQVGQAGDWVAIRGSNGRRLWLPATAVEALEGKARPTTPAVTPLPVTPPTIEVESLPRVVNQPTLKLTGVARHPDRMHDVVVSVKPAGPAQVEQKIFYRASEQKSDGHSLEFSTEIPLQPGSNQILVTARDRNEVESTRELLVFRE